ncbi:MAG TPA: LnmK family bifunctional acyltransferase/decarboxylase [Micromonosporaceae bacterium]
MLSPPAVPSPTAGVDPAPTADPATVTRTEVVRPAMCGHNSLLLGRIGDWTWDAVAAVCDTDVLRAFDPSGAPTYLSFYYYRVRGGRRFHLRTPSFGDRLHVTSRVFGFGSESVLTLHRLARTPAGERSPDPDDIRPIDPDEFYRAGDDGHLYVENFNRWITRSDAASNEGLVRSSPIGFRHSHLPRLPDRYSPRLACHRARTRLTFVDDETQPSEPSGEPFTVDYPVDASRDLNGVGLLYFATYFSIVDWALLRFWQQLGGDVRSFLDRIVVDQQLCYLGNADAGTVVRVTVRRRSRDASPDLNVIDVVLRDRASDRLLAVCTLQLLNGGHL